MSCQPRFKLSFAQQRLWLLNEMDRDISIAYNIPVSLCLHGPLDVPSLERSIAEIIRRHGTLRTTFEINPISGAPEQIVHASGPFTLKVTEVQGESDPERESSVLNMVRTETRRPFDLRTGPLFRAVLLRRSPESHVLAISMHHIVSDGWSVGVLIRELTGLYEAFSRGETTSPLPSLPLQYVDYANWQLKRIGSAVMQGQLQYWREQLKDPLPVLELPTGRTRPAVYDERGSERIWDLERSLSERVKDFSRSHGVTPFMVLLAAFNLLLHRYSGQEDIIVGTPIAGRTRRETEGLIGVFVNTLVIRTDLAGNPPVIQLLNRVKEVSLEAFANQEVPFERLVEELQPQRDLSRSPVFQVMFVLQNAPAPRLKMGDVLMRPLIVEGVTSKFDMTLALMEQEDGCLRGWLEYNLSLFDAATAERLIGHYENILNSLLSDSGSRISELQMLSKEQRNMLLTEWNDTQFEHPCDALVPELFDREARQFGDRISLASGEHHLSYSGLSHRSNKLAHFLNELGVGPEVRVGVCTDRTPEVLIALLGVLKAGGVYVPLDSSYPRERIVYMLGHSQMQVLVTNRELADRVPLKSLAVVLIDSDWPEIEKRVKETPRTRILPENLSHLIYTSGSTGKPKAVAIRHKSTAILIAWAIHTFGADRLAGVLASTSICFDLSVYEMFAPLCCGGTVYLVNNGLEVSESLFASALTLVNTVPSAMAALIGQFPGSVRTLNLAGEALKAELVQEIFEGTAVEELFNLYGPSEDTTYSTFASVPRKGIGKPAIGRPIANTQVYLLDESLSLVPPAATGHLHLSGDGLARGYFNAPDLTADRFTPCPFGNAPGAIMYKTGDLARHLPDGQLDYLGRIDHQVKIRGYRIEIGEVEAALASHQTLKFSTVVAREDTPGDKRLVAYCVLNQSRERESHREAPGETSGEVIELSLRNHLRRSLPEYMVPSAFVILERMPLSPNGKVDRKALPPPQGGARDLARDWNPPVTEAEEVLASIFKELLRVGQVSRNDNFFDLGGHSLLAVKLVSRASLKFGVPIPLRLAFEFPTLAGFAESVSGIDPSAHDDSGQIERMAPPTEELLLAQLDQLSDREIDALLMEVESRRNEVR